MIGGPVPRAGAVLLATGLAILPSTASAVEFYFGLGTGQAKSSDYGDYVDDGSFTAGGVEGSDTGLRLFGGVGFAKNFGVELAYVDLGGSTTRAQSGGGGVWPAGSVAHDLGTSGIEASVFSRLAVSDSA
ncbi:MAG: hypothetical protein ACRETF_01060, partial [Nevskiaceae bacterium]